MPSLLLEGLRIRSEYGDNHGSKGLSDGTEKTGWFYRDDARHAGVEWAYDLFRDGLQANQSPQFC